MLSNKSTLGWLKHEVLTTEIKEKMERKRSPPEFFSRNSPLSLVHQQATSPEGWQIQQQAYCNTHEKIVIDEDSSQNIMIFNNYKKTLFSDSQRSSTECTCTA